MEQHDVLVIEISEQKQEIRDTMDFDMDLEVQTLELGGAYGESRSGT